MSWILYERSFLTCMESVCQVSLSGRREFTRGQTWLWALGETEWHDNFTTDCGQLCGLTARINTFISILVYLSSDIFILGSVNIDSVWSAAHSQSSALQYPFLVQPKSSGTPQPCPAAEPCPPLSGKPATFLVLLCMWGIRATACCPSHHREGVATVIVQLDLMTHPLSDNLSLKDGDSSVCTRNGTENDGTSCVHNFLKLVHTAEQSDKHFPPIR